jgi:surfeit locus 1 family protein
VTIRPGNRRFKPSVLGTVLTLAGLALFVRLGLWQINRANEKNALIAQFDHGDTRPVELDAAGGGALPRYQRVQVSGRYDSKHQVLIDNMPSQTGQAGFRVLTPLQLDDGRWQLVDRGWVPLGATRTELPWVDVAPTPRAVLGRLDDLPVPGVRMAAGTVPLPTSWPSVMNFPRHEDLERALSRPLLARIVRLDADQPDGYERVWLPTFGFGPERHFGYAFQWFALALAVLITYLVLSFKRVTHDGR